MSGMSTITFDTFKFVERLEKAGLSRDQAAAIVEAQKDAFAEALDSSLATKSDIARLESRMDSMGKEMQAMEYRLIIKLGAFIAIAAGILIAVLRVPH
jgi:hypothetical protein